MGTSKHGEGGDAGEAGSPGTPPAASEGSKKKKAFFIPPAYGKGSPPKCGLSSRSLLGDLKAFERSTLKSCVTVVTREDGTKYVEAPSAECGEGRIARKVSDASETFGSSGFFVGSDQDDKKPVPVVGGLFIGSVGGAKNLKGLQAASITHVVNCAPIVPSFHQGRFKYLSIDVYDSPEANIDEHFEQTNKFIREALEGGGNVFVHCYAGVSRSAAIVLAYLIGEMGYDVGAALALLSESRPMANPNEGFREQLSSYSESLGRVPPASSHDNSPRSYDGVFDSEFDSERGVLVEVQA